MEKMYAAVLHGINDLRYEKVDIPELGPNDVLVKVKACGICGSDIPRVLQTGTYHFPTIPGHEFGGIVVKSGSNVKPGILGKKVAVIPLIPCRECKSCEVGDFALCENYDFLGSRNDGGFAEYVKVPESNLVFVPESVDLEYTAFLEPISVAHHVVSNNKVQYGDDVVVFGLGAIGIFIAQWVKICGARHVFAVDLDPKKVELAKQIGIQDAVCATPDELEKIVYEKTDGAGCDVVFEASGASVVFNQAISLIKQNGRLGLVGRPTNGLTISNESYEKILRKQITIKGTWSFEFKNYPHNEWDIALEALKKGEIQVQPIISHRIPLKQVYEGIQIMANKTEDVFKILVEPELD